MAIHRDLFPVAEKHVFLNNAAEAPLNVRTRNGVHEFLEAASTAPHTKPAGVREAVRARLAGLLGGAPEEYACVTSTCHALNLVAAGLEWRAGDNIVVPAGEHWTNLFPWLNLKDKGVEVRLVPFREDNALHLDDVRARVDARTRILSVAYVQFATGYRADLKALARIAHAHGALFVVDGIQGAGVCPLNVVDDEIDVLAAAGFKWLLGMTGTGFLYVRRGLWGGVRPSAPGVFAAPRSFEELAYFEDARRYESGSMADALLHGWAAGLDLVAAIGIDCIFKRCLHLVDLLVAGLRGISGVRVVTPIADVRHRSAIVVATTGSPDGDAAVFARLDAARILVADRGSGIRISPNFYNSEDDVRRLLEVWRGEGAAKL